MKQLGTMGYLGITAPGERQSGTSCRATKDLPSFLSSLPLLFLLLLFCLLSIQLPSLSPLSSLLSLPFPFFSYSQKSMEVLVSGILSTAL